MSKNEEEERRVIRLVDEKKSFLLTGCAGTGKSYMTNLIISRVRGRTGVAITATTGIAADNINGVTFQSYLGVGINKTATTMLSNIRNHGAWKKLSTLIIDEVSMLGGNYFDELEYVARVEKNSSEFFGGIHLILIGDFFQLPPVEKKEVYLFESTVFKQYITEIVNLRFIYRQSDPQFIKLLNDVRFGILTNEGLSILNSCVRPLDVSNGVLPTHLFSLVKTVNAYNNFELNKLKGTVYVYDSIDCCDESKITDKKMLNRLNKSTRIPEILRLKIGAQVMYLKNKSQHDLFNGSRGVVVGFNNTLPIVKFNNGRIFLIKQFLYEKIVKVKNKEYTLTRIQIPLCLAWAMTIHKEQGMTLEKVVISMKRIFAPGQVYVALSRVKTLNGLQVLDINKEAVKTSKKILQFYSKFDPDVKNVYKKRKAEIQLQQKPKRRKKR